jgi:hypothetical protein
MRTLGAIPEFLSGTCDSPPKADIRNFLADNILKV